MRMEMIALIRFLTRTIDQKLKCDWVKYLHFKYFLLQAEDICENDMFAGK